VSQRTNPERCQNGGASARLAGVGSPVARFSRRFRTIGNRPVTTKAKAQAKKKLRR